MHPGYCEPTPIPAVSEATTQPLGDPALRPHPFLFIDAGEIARARERIEQEARYRGTLERMRNQAEEDLAIELPAFERQWWREARTKPWRDIYQEIAHHTLFVPLPAMTAARRLALVSLLTGEERYARRARAILLHYTDYTFEFEHYDVGMNYVIWGVPALDVYDMLYDRFDAAGHERTRAFFRRFFTAVMKNDRFWVENEPGGRFNNHYAFHKQAIAAIGLFFGRDDLVRYAIESPEGIRDLMENGIVDNGLWLEGSFHYHFTPLHGLVPLAEMFRHAGGPIDLYRATFRGDRTLKQLFDTPFEFVFPDGLVPNIGDAYGRDSYLPDQHVYEYAYAAYGDPHYAWLLSRPWPGPDNERARLAREQAALLYGRPWAEASTPTVPSRVFPEHGYVFLRVPGGEQYWRGRGWAALLTFDKAGIHSHADKLGLILWGRGRLLAQDVEGRATRGHSFSSAIQRELNRRTLCSNTVVVDGRDQRSPRRLLRLADFAATAAMARATIADGEGLLYPGVRQQRTVIVTPDYVLDVFRLHSGGEHTYDWTFHPRDENGRTQSSLPFQPLAPAESPSAGWIRNGRCATTDGAWSADWADHGVRLHLTMPGVPGTEVRLWDFPRDDAFSSPPIPLLQVRRRTRATDFVAVYQSSRKPIPAMQLNAHETQRGILQVEIQDSDRRDRWAIPAFTER